MRELRQPVRVGFLGVGPTALEHAAAATGLGHLVAAGCATAQDSPRWKRFKSSYPAAELAPDAESLLDHPEVEAVVASLPWYVTESFLPAILASEKPVLIEKPVALSAGALESALDPNGAITHNKFVALNRRSYSTVVRLKERVALGGMKSAEIVISETVERLSRLFGAEIVPHIAIYSSCHILDAANFVLGNLTLVRTYTHPEKSQDAFQSVSALLETPDGAPVFLTLAAENPAPVGIRVMFDDGTTWHLSPMERLNAYQGYQSTEPSPTSNIRRFVPKSFLELAEDGNLKPGFSAQMTAFLGGDGSDSLVSLTEHLELMQLIDALYAQPKPKWNSAPQAATI